jgi:GNAT superfamily N-acetyltransferase
MIRRCTETDLDGMYSIINDAAQAYKGLIPDDRWHEPYMPMEELEGEIRDGVEEDCELAGVMGIQDRGVVTLMRHAYVRTARQKRGIGTRLLRQLEGLTHKPILIGTWVAAIWAVRFYKKNGYTSLSRVETEGLLRLYWSIPERQIATSVVLANTDWRSANQGLHDIVV